jgi:hypothetical protein
MRRVSIALATLALTGSLGLAEERMPFEQPFGDISAAETRVSSVESVTINTMTVENDGRIVIIAEGSVPTSGWTNAQLRPWVYVVPPEDGIYQFDMVATPPPHGTIVLPAFMTISAAQAITQVPEGFKGATVHGQTNSATATLP